MDKKILSISDAASILGVSDETLRNWEREGKLSPFHTEGGHRRYYRADIEKLAGIYIEPRGCTTDCRLENGVTVGLIDAIISIARILRKRDFNDEAVKEAILDFKSDEDINFLINL